MARYIELSVLLAEIERRIVEFKDMKIDSSYYEGMVASLKFFRDEFINTIEVKEVDLEKETKRWWKEHLHLNPENKLWMDAHQSVVFAKYFFELGLKAKNWEKERMEECPYRQVGCTMYEDKILECKGACSWVVDYPKLKELKAQKGE